MSDVSLWTIFRVWLTLGISSFGGGVATLTMIRRMAVERFGWLTEDEFARMWALVQLPPGINLVSLTILIGKKTGGEVGIALALLGLLLPSGLITVLVTAAYAHIENVHAVRAALAGVIPATCGVGFVTAFQNVRPFLKPAKLVRAALTTRTVLVLVLSAALALTGRVPVVGIILLAGTVSAIFHSALRSPPPPTDLPEAAP